MRARRTSSRQLARLEDHLRLGVEAGDLGVRVALEQAPGRLAGAEPELEDPPGAKGIASIVASWSSS